MEETTSQVATQIVLMSESMDQYYEILKWVVGIVGFLLAVVLFYVIIILRDASYVSQKTRETSDTINEYVKRPAGMIMRAFSTMEGASEIIMSQVGKMLAGKKKSRRKKDEDEE